MFVVGVAAASIGLVGLVVLVVLIANDRGVKQGIESGEVVRKVMESQLRALKESQRINDAYFEARSKVRDLRRQRV